HPADARHCGPRRSPGLDSKGRGINSFFSGATMEIMGISACGQEGSRSENVAPLPRRLVQKTVPDIASASFLTIDNPKPVEDSPPVGRAVRRVNLPNSFFWSSSLKPGP